MKDSQNIVPWKQATISNNFMFRLVMERPEMCKTLLERILGIEIKTLRYLEPEKSMEAKLLSKGIRLDLYVEDSDGIAYDIEMQTGSTEKSSLGKRTRYYQSLMDGDALKKGIYYADLRKSIIIFICTFDPFGAGQGKYVFRNLSVEDHALELSDATEKIFLNTEGDRHRLSKDLANLLEYIGSGKVSDDYTRMMEEMVTDFREDNGKEELYMTYQQSLMEAEHHGIKTGISLGKIQSAKDMIKAGLTTFEVLKNSGLYTKEELAAISAS